uniref:Armadillo repeat-containing protein 8 n=1 Tax=Noctiluca scintillans TaxID=2966 RepID=A0A7S1A370_NOCSC|mmetsp:Transcript_29724/g.78934  ORF Transcript_29724/g.78934 Transcript_29724/m.78934 type:complete len:612 (+) Transcript_29724:107-1942(+)
MPPLLTSLVSLLEQSQASDTVNSETLLKHLIPLEPVIDQKSHWQPGELQRVVGVFCGWLRGHEGYQDDRCIRLMLRILSKLLGQDQDADNVAIQKGLITTATTLVKGSSGDVLLMKCSLEVLATLCVVDNSDTIINRSGTVPCIVELLKQHANNVELLEDAITTLALMAKRTRHRRTLQQQCGGSGTSSVTHVVEVLKRNLGNPSLVTAVCRFHQSFAVKDECCLVVLASGGVAALTAAFEQRHRQGDPRAANIRTLVASTIWTCSTSCQEVQRALLAADFQVSLAAVAKENLDNAEFQEAALGIVRGLSRIETHRQNIVDLGFVDMAIHSMRAFPDDAALQKEACGLFGHLAADPGIREFLGQVGAINEIVTALSRCEGHDDRKLAKIAMGALSNLSCFDRNRDILATTQVVQVLLGAVRFFMHLENILEQSITVISHIAVHPECNRQLVQFGAVEALLLFLEEHVDDLVILRKSLIALRHCQKHSLLSSSEPPLVSVTQQIAHAGKAGSFNGVSLLIKTMNTHNYDPTVVKEVSLLLTVIARVNENVPTLMGLAVQPCMKALEFHRNDQPVSDALAGLLSMLPLEEDDTWTSDPTPLSTGPLNTPAFMM